MKSFNRILQKIFRSYGTFRICFRVIFGKILSTSKKLSQNFRSIVCQLLFIYVFDHFPFAAADPERHHLVRVGWSGGVTSVRAIVHCSHPSGGLPHPSTFLPHYINYGYQYREFLKLCKIVVSWHTFFF